MSIYTPQFTPRVVADIRIAIDQEHSISFHAVGSTYADLITDAKLWIENHVLRNWGELKGPFVAKLCCTIDGFEICLLPTGRTIKRLIEDAKHRLSRRLLGPSTSAPSRRWSS